MSRQLDSLLKEKRVFNPSGKIVEESNIEKWINKHKIKDYNDLFVKDSENPQWF